MFPLTLTQLFHVQAIELKTFVDNVSLDIDTAIPCGLIINELVINSLKHGFPLDSESGISGGQKGNISIELHSIGNGKLVLSVSDNGVGFPADVDFRNSESLGLKLVNTLTEQLGGVIKLNRANGTEFKITFSEPKLKER